MDNEYQILNEINENNSASQRELAKKTGLSLGGVNILIKRLVKKGLVKMERLNQRTIRYILTPEGIKQKTKATYRYILSSYRYINEIEKKLDTLIESNKLKVNKVILFGPKDEISEFIMSRLKNRGIEIVSISNENHLTKDSENDLITLTWHPEYSEKLSEVNIKHLNLLQNI